MSLLPALLLACAGAASVDSGDAGTTPGGLIQADAWVLDLDHDDPLADHRPDDPWCAATAVSLEYGGVEIDTGQCTYAQLVQPLGEDLTTGDAVEVAAWHQQLVAEAPADAHIAVLIGDTVLWEAWTRVPGDAEAWTETVSSPRDLPAGTPVLLHVHNHGANTWNLERVARPD